MDTKGKYITVIIVVIIVGIVVTSIMGRYIYLCFRPSERNEYEELNSETEMYVHKEEEEGFETDNPLCPRQYDNNDDDFDINNDDDYDKDDYDE